MNLGSIKRAIVFFYNLKSLQFFPEKQKRNVLLGGFECVLENLCAAKEKTRSLFWNFFSQKMRKDEKLIFSFFVSNFNLAAAAWRKLVKQKGWDKNDSILKNSSGK